MWRGGKKLPRGYYYNRLKQKNLITNLNDKQKGPIDCLTDRGIPNNMKPLKEAPSIGARPKTLFSIDLEMNIFLWTTPYFYRRPGEDLPWQDELLKVFYGKKTGFLEVSLFLDGLENVSSLEDFETVFFP